MTATTSFAAEVTVDKSGHWTGNSLRFATEAEATAYVTELSWRWFLVIETRVVPSADPVNAIFDGKLVVRYMTPLLLAERLARAAHAGHVEKLTGDNYVHHLERVVALVAGDEAKAVAWLHDVLEDTPVTAAELLAAGVPAPIVEAVVVLTEIREPGKTKAEIYPTYIASVLASENPLALAVKLADLVDHLRPMEGLVLPTSMRRRYEIALRRLEA